MSALNLLATLESKISAEPEPPKEAPEGEESEGEEAPEGEESEGEESEGEESEGEEAPEGEESEGEESEALDGALKLDPKATYTIDGKAVTGDELERRGLRQADYTRKTQQLAEVRKAADAKIEGLEDENEELKTFVSDLQASPEDMAFNLRRYFPRQYEDLKDAIIQEALTEHDMTERERELAEENKHARDARKAAEKDAAFRKAREDRKTVAQKTGELTKQFHQWTLETMAESGLDTDNAEHMELLRGLLSRRANRGETWTRETFQQETARLAKTLGVKAKPKAPEKKPAPKGPERRLPPARSTGARAPAGTSTPAPKAKTRAVGDAFSELRRKHGLI